MFSNKLTVCWKCFTTTKMSAPPSSTTPTFASRMYLCGIGLLLTLVGGVFCWLIIRSYLRSSETRRWPEMECVIISSTISERRVDPNGPVEYQPQFLYGFEWNGIRRTGNKLSLRGSPWSGNRTVAEQLTAKYPEKMKTTCYIDSHNPDNSILKPDSIATLYSLWFPGIFLIGGLIISAKSLRAKVT